MRRSSAASAAVAIQASWQQAQRPAGATRRPPRRRYALKDASENGRLTSATYQRLQLGSVVKSLGYLAAFAQAQPLWTPVLGALYPTAAAASVVINLGIYKVGWGLRAGWWSWCGAGGAGAGAGAASGGTGP